jgi:Sugar-transfer associated ATP-grasp
MIDLDTGILGPGAMVGGRNRVVWCDRHPETHARISGVEVPGWPELRDKVLEWSRRFSFAPCIGWDIVITRDGYSIIEGNSSPGLTMLQIHGPLLADPRVRRFYRQYGIVR